VCHSCRFTPLYRYTRAIRGAAKSLWESVVSTQVGRLHSLTLVRLPEYRDVMPGGWE
jgi:hypothetical protein